MKRFLTSRRGAAIEMAIGMMFLIMALTIILLTNGMLQASHAKDDLNDFEEKIALYEVGEYALANPAATEYETNGVVYNISNYTVDSVTTYTITQGDDVVLTIEAGTDGKITSWK